jgi:fatty acyl-CoA reductase
MTRVVSVSGDCTLPKCGLEPEDWETMAAEVTHVFHAAAALRMDEHLRAAYAINVQATKDLIALAENMKKLRVRSDRNQSILFDSLQNDSP